MKGFIFAYLYYDSVFFLFICFENRKFLKRFIQISKKEAKKEALKSTPKHTLEALFLLGCLVDA